MRAKPFIKWAGGKGQLLDQLEKYIPRQLDGSPFTYIEPFVGGGAMLFYMLQNHPEIKCAVINDINDHLINVYKVIKEHPKELIERLSLLEKHYLAIEREEEKKNYYLDVREVFNENELDDIDRAKYLLFLNRTCFNGLYRENSKGKFNVPFGRYLHPKICNEEIILADSEILNRANVIILNGDYSETIHYLDDGGMNFVYFDPPYRPINATSNFNSYVKEKFNDEEQIRLGSYAKEIDGLRRVFWMMSNSDCSAKNHEDLFFEELYGNYYINRVYATRAINANPEKRGRLTELVICNYPSDDNLLSAAEAE